MRGKHLFLAGLTGACAMLASPFVCRAKTITVNSLIDPGASGICALRDAITAANNKTTVHQCESGSGNDTIVFNSGLSGIITLSSSLPIIANTLTIQGTETSPPAITISGGGNVDLLLMVFEGATLNLNYLILTDANDIATNGGGLAGAIWNLGGTLNVANSTFSDNSALGGSGGIVNEATATATVVNSTFSGNSGYTGGGIANEGSCTVVNSTFSGNSAPDGFGGGIGNLALGTLTVVNSTFSGNTAALGGGGIFNENATVNLKGTVLASPTGGNCDSSLGSINDKGYNLADDDSCNFTSGTSAVVTDADLKLGSLANNGGPTDTIALGDTSVAIGVIPAGPSGSCNYVNDVNPCTSRQISPASGQLLCDQRGDSRPEQVTGCDVGAFEFQEITHILDFDTGLIVFPLQFAAGGSFTLAPDASINPLTQAVTVTLSSVPPLSSGPLLPSFGPLAVTIPPGSFRLVRGQYQYSGTIGGIKYGASISGPVGGVYQFTFAAFGLDVTGITNPVTVTLQIGSNLGTDDDVAAAIL